MFFPKTQFSATAERFKHVSAFISATFTISLMDFSCFCFSNVLSLDPNHRKIFRLILTIIWKIWRRGFKLCQNAILILSGCHFPILHCCSRQYKAPAALASPALPRICLPSLPNQFEFRVTVVPFHQPLCNMLQKHWRKRCKERQKKDKYFCNFLSSTGIQLLYDIV